MSTQNPLDGKLAIVTGASRGIGAAICRNLAGKGCSLVMNYTSELSASLTATLAEELESTFLVRAITVQADMGSLEGPAKIVDSARQAFGSNDRFQIDIIINNAGILTS